MAFGGEFIYRPSSWRRILRFAGFATVAALSPSAYGPATREVAVKQIYLTAWQALPRYILFAGLLSLILIEIVSSASRRYGLAQHALELTLRVLVLELIPLLTALFVALRSGAAIGAEIALMCVSGELQDEKDAGASPLHGELVPRIVAAALSVFSLTTLSCALALLLAYAVFYGVSPWGLHEFSRIVGNVFDAPVLIGFVLKCVLFGLAVALIPIATGLEAERGKPKSVPFAVLAGLVKLFVVIMAIEVLSLVVKYV
jgi:phospholipid/cholesterol/gamma-HCH transport system permease protein